MRLLTGPAGSGKTTFILDQFRSALRAGDEAVRLLVPTATMAQHLQNRLARDGFVFRRSLIQTLSGFVENWAADIPQAPDSILYLIVEQAARRVNRPEFARVAHLPGFCATLARTIAEFSSAGCDSARLAACLPDAQLAPAFLAVYREVDAELARRRLALRSKRLELAAERIADSRADGIRAIWIDGFHALPDPELRVIAALGRYTGLTLTLNDSEATAPTRERLLAMGFQEEATARSRSTPALALVQAPAIEREAEEIARRILEQSASGRPFREIGIVVRAAESYVPILRSTLERFGIPARFYFDSRLEEHAAIRFLAGAVDAMLGGWDHAQTLAILRLAPRLTDASAMDRFDFAVRERIPNAGLEALKQLSTSDSLSRSIDDLATLEEWRSLTLTPQAWSTRFLTLRNLFRAARPAEPANHELALLYRSQATVLDLFDHAVEEAATAFDPSLDPAPAVPLEDFWSAVKSVLRLKPLRLPDGRRNVVHVLSAPEARQWVLPVIFVCGMVEKQFPQFHRQDPFFPDAARVRLNAAGIRVRTAAEFEREERALFDSAITRATMLVTLSYPEFDARGDRNLPSIFLEDFDFDVQQSRSVRPQPRHVIAPRLDRSIDDPLLLDFLRQKTAKVSPTALEMYLQCAFQYFGGRTLRLKTAPDRPEERLNFILQGSVVHEVLAAWYPRPEQDITALFEAVFEREVEKLNIPNGYHTERLRNGMLEDLKAFAKDAEWQRDGFQSSMEKKFVFPLDETLEISGQIDRLDVAPDGRAYVIDYKYSAAQRIKAKLKDENLLQAPLYMMAAEHAFKVQPDGMFYVGVKAGVEYVGWSASGLLDSVPLPENWQQAAKERILRAVGQVRAGRVEVSPANPDNCRFCDFRDVCRVQVRKAAVVAETA
jgi:ATP-dependent helicase/DNAse subunit B